MVKSLCLLQFRCAFTKLASSSEAYFVLRSHFIQSYSCLCMAHYILGIGDRHLNNMLIDNGTGGVVGIDFGYAFGVATQVIVLIFVCNFLMSTTKHLNKN